MTYEVASARITHGEDAAMRLPTPSDPDFIGPQERHFDLAEPLLHRRAEDLARIQILRPELFLSHYEQLKKDIQLAVIDGALELDDRYLEVESLGEKASLYAIDIINAARSAITPEETKTSAVERSREAVVGLSHKFVEAANLNEEMQLGYGTDRARAQSTISKLQVLFAATNPNPTVWAEFTKLVDEYREVSAEHSTSVQLELSWTDRFKVIAAQLGHLASSARL